MSRISHWWNSIVLFTAVWDTLFVNEYLGTRIHLHRKQINELKRITKKRERGKTGGVGVFHGGFCWLGVEVGQTVEAEHIRRRFRRAATLDRAKVARAIWKIVAQAWRRRSLDACASIMHAWKIAGAEALAPRPSSPVTRQGPLFFNKHSRVTRPRSCDLANSLCRKANVYFRRLPAFLPTTRHRPRFLYCTFSFAKLCYALTCRSLEQLDTQKFTISIVFAPLFELILGAKYRASHYLNFANLRQCFSWEF